MDVSWIEGHGVQRHETDLLELSPGTVSAGHKKKRFNTRRKKKKSKGKSMSHMGKHINLENFERKYAMRE